MTEQLQKAEKFTIPNWMSTAVQRQVVPMLPRGQAEWADFVIAFESALTKDDTFGRGSLRLAIQKNPKAALLALTRCARLGLSLHPAHEHFYLIPRGGVVNGEIGYRGYLHLIDGVEDGGADVIYKAEYSREKPLVDGPSGAILHIPHYLERGSYDDKDIVGAYAWVKLVGRPKIVHAILDRARIDKLRGMGQGGPAWSQHFAAMCLAKAWKALGKNPTIPMQQRHRDTIGELDREEEAATAPLPQTPRITVVDEPPPASANPEWDAAQQEQFAQLDEDPLPDAETELKNLRQQVNVLVTEKRLNAAGLATVLKAACGPKPPDLDKLSAEQCERVLKELRES